MTAVEDAKATLSSLRKTHLTALAAWEVAVRARDLAMLAEATAWQDADHAASAVLIQMARVRELEASGQTAREPSSED